MIISLSWFLMLCLLFLDGINVDPLDTSCTHIVVDSIQGDMPHVKFNFKILPKLKDVFIVYKEWFWCSIEQEGKADEYQEQFAYPLKVS